MLFFLIFNTVHTEKHEVFVQYLIHVRRIGKSDPEHRSPTVELFQDDE